MGIKDGEPSYNILIALVFGGVYFGILNFVLLPYFETSGFPLWIQIAIVLAFTGLLLGLARLTLKIIEWYYTRH